MNQGLSCLVVCLLLLGACLPVPIEAKKDGKSFIKKWIPGMHGKDEKRSHSVVKSSKPVLNFVDTDYGFKCTISMAELGVKTCDDLALMLGLKKTESHILINSKNSKSCSESGAEITDEMSYPCNPMEQQQQQQDLHAVRQTGSGQQQPQKPLYTCSVTMQQVAVTSCWDLAVALGLDGSQHESIISSKTGQKCADSNPQATDQMAYPCNQPPPPPPPQSPASTGFSLANTQSIPQQQQQTFQCSTTMQQVGVNTCWDLAVALGLEGSRHDILINFRNDQPCAESNVQPEDYIAYPCSQPQYTQMLEIRNKEQATKKHKKNGKGKKVSPVEMEGTCITTMKKANAFTCYDLAIGVGLSGNQHEHIINVRNKKKCQDSGPQPDDNLAYPCPMETALLQQNDRKTRASMLTAATTAMVNASSHAAVERKINPIKFDATCMSTMQKANIFTCYDLAIAIGLNGNQHDQIINTKNGEKCANSAPQPEDDLAYPCTESEALIQRQEREVLEHEVQAEKARLLAKSGKASGNSIALGGANLTGSSGARDSHCLTTMSLAMVFTCYDLAVSMGMRGTDNDQILNTRNQMVCKDSNPQPEDTFQYPCTAEDAALQAQASKEAQNAADVVLANSTGIRDSQCRSTMGFYKVSSCFDFAVHVGMQGDDHIKIINEDNKLPCQDSSPQPDDGMLYPCTQEEAIVNKKFAPKDCKCLTTLNEHTVSTCYELAVKVNLEGNQHVQITNTKNNMPCQGSNPQPQDTMSYPCTADEAHLLATKKDARCTTTMSEHSVSSCFDLATAVGLEGTEHTQILNIDHNMPCETSEPQPKDEMSYPCTQEQRKKQDANIHSESVQTFKKEAAGFDLPDSAMFDLPLDPNSPKDAMCKTNMAGKSVESCWDLAVAMNMDGASHGQILSEKTKKPCSESNPQPDDIMLYPCTTKQYDAQTALIDKMNTVAANSTAGRRHSKYDAATGGLTCMYCFEGSSGPCINTGNQACFQKDDNGVCPIGATECGVCTNCYGTSVGWCQNEKTGICFDKVHLLGYCPPQTHACSI